MVCPCRFQCILEYVEKPLSKVTADIGAVLAKAPCSRHIFHMNLDPPTAPAMLPRQAEGLTAAIGAAYQYSGTGPDQQKATTADACYGVTNPQSAMAALTEPLQGMQHVTAGMHLSVSSTGCTWRFIAGWGCVVFLIEWSSADLRSLYGGIQLHVMQLELDEGVLSASKLMK